jgi:PPE-repeat protein
MDYGVLPPEINSGRMYAGPGSGPMMAAAAAWNGLATELSSAAAGYDSATSQLTEEWLGPASASMAVAAAPYLGWLSHTAAHAQQAGNHAASAAAAYDTAFAATVPPAMVGANRSQLADLVATNIFGQNTARIAANEAAYAEMWAQDAHAMYGYAGSSSAATALTPFTQPPQTTSPAGQSAQAAAVTHAAGTAAATHSATPLSQLMSAVPQQLQTLSTAGPLGSAAPASSALAGVDGFNTLTGPTSFATALGRTVFTAGTFSTGIYRSILQGSGLATHIPTLQPDNISTAHAATLATKTVGAEGVRGPVLASAGQAAPVGGLSVPQSWASVKTVATAVEDPPWLSANGLEHVTTSEEAPATPMVGGGPAAGMGPMAGMLARPTVSNILRVDPRRFKMPRPAVGG